MNRGQILAQGSLSELAHRHHEDDFEELFFQLISDSEKKLLASQNA